jgi:two-component system, chemotaxis family, chemotaxis protein CheY
MSYPNIRVLIIDTEASVQNIKPSLMKELGFIGENIYSTNSFKEALEVLGSTAIDLILSEWEVSGVSGFDFFKEVRGHKKYANLPFIIISSENDYQAIRQNLAGKVIHNIVKPFSAHDFRSKLQQVLKTERRVDERSDVIKENKVIIIHVNKPVTNGKIVNVGKGGFLAQLEVSRKLIIYDQPTIHISFYDSPSKELTKTFNAELLRIERASRDKTKKTGYYAFAFIKLDKIAQKFLAQLMN